MLKNQKDKTANRQTKLQRVQRRLSEYLGERTANWSRQTKIIVFAVIILSFAACYITILANVLQHRPHNSPSTNTTETHKAGASFHPP